jgi:hypothetical protein
MADMVARITIVTHARHHTGTFAVHRWRDVIHLLTRKTPLQDIPASAAGGSGEHGFRMVRQDGADHGFPTPSPLF